MNRRRRWSILLARALYLPPLVWALLRLLSGDRSPLVFAVTSLAQYFFLLLPPLAAVAFTARAREPWIGLALSAAVWSYLCGGLFVNARLISGSPSNPGDPGATLSVMSYNVLGYNTDARAVVAAIRASNADVVALQELNPGNAEAIRRELGGEYPYQVLDPANGVTGGGVISRRPLRTSGERLPGVWIGTPQVLSLDLAGRPITLLRFHAYSGTWAVREREAEARVVAELAASRGPLIAAGDLNATDLSAAYGTITGVLRDSWREAGWGFGHTFPGADSPGGSRPKIAGFPVPMWLVRIDHIFHSPDLIARAARIGPHDGVSDHRPVIAEISFK